MEKEIESLVKKAAVAHSADDAMKFAQAACNAAKAMRELADIKTSRQP